MHLVYFNYVFVLFFFYPTYPHSNCKAEKSVFFSLCSWFCVHLVHSQNFQLYSLTSPFSLSSPHFISSPFKCFNSTIRNHWLHITLKCIQFFISRFFGIQWRNAWALCKWGPRWWSCVAVPEGWFGSSIWMTTSPASGGDHHAKMKRPRVSLWRDSHKGVLFRACWHVPNPLIQQKEQRQ